jgi:phosphatidate cytidylyltransferase
MVGLLLFVLSLEKGTYRYQFQRFSWSLLALMIVFCLPSLVTFNMYKGIFWLVFPHTCVIVNDICAYLFGFFLGKTPLIKLSPKKTWEGFFGGIFSTYLWAMIVRLYMQN